MDHRILFFAKSLAGTGKYNTGILKVIPSHSTVQRLSRTPQGSGCAPVHLLMNSEQPKKSIHQRGRSGLWAIPPALQEEMPAKGERPVPIANRQFLHWCGWVNTKTVFIRLWYQVSGRIGSLLEPAGTIGEPDPFRVFNPTGRDFSVSAIPYGADIF
jgi:hypothetical protein